MRAVQLSDLPGKCSGPVVASCGSGVEFSYSGEVLNLIGSSRNDDIGLRLHVPANSSIYIPELLVENCFVNIWKTGHGQLTIDRLTGREFGGDNASLRGSNVLFNEVIVRGNTPTRPYNMLIRRGLESVEDCLDRHGEVVFDSSLLKFEAHPKSVGPAADPKYDGIEVLMGSHVDAIAQIYAFKEDGITPDFDGVIKNIRLPSIDAEINGRQSQGVMGSESCLCDGFEIGSKKYRVKLDGYKYHTVFNTISNSVIGCEGADVDGQLKIKDVKRSRYQSKDNRVVGLSESSVVCEAGSVEFVTGQCFADDYHHGSLGPEVKEMSDFTEIPASTLEQYAAEDGVEVEAYEAIVNKESRGKTHYKGRVLKLFERHVNDRALRRYGIDPAHVVAQDPSAQDVIGYRPYVTYGSLQQQQNRFDKACTIHEKAAIEACSWGFAQVLGENWKMCGFKSPEDFRHAMQTKQGQLYAFIQYIRNRNGLLDALRSKDWPTVKRLYNGTKETDKNGDGVDDYTADLIKEYTRAVLRRAPKKGVAKSRTMRNNAVGAVAKVVAGGSIALNADSFSGLVGTLVSSREKIQDVKNTINDVKDTVSEVKGSVIEVKDSVAVIGDQLVFANDAVAGLWYLPWALFVILIIALIPHARVAYTYMQDHGYIKGGSDVL